MLVTSIRCPDHNRICDLVVGVFTNGAYRKMPRNLNTLYGESWQALVLRVVDFRECVIPVVHDAIEEADAIAFKHVVAHGADLEARGASGRPPIGAAVWSASNALGAMTIEANPGSYTHQLAKRRRDLSLKHLRALIALGVDVNLPDKGADTPLIEAASLGDADLVQELLLAGARPMDRNRIGNTPLHECMAHAIDERKGRPLGERRLSLAKVLIRAGVDAGARNFTADSPLHLLLSRRHPMDREVAKALVELLLQHGARLEARNEAGLTPLLAGVACNFDSGCTAAFEAVMMAGARVDAKSSNGYGIAKVASAVHKRYVNSLLLAGKIDSAFDKEQADQSQDVRSASAPKSSSEAMVL